MAAKLSTGLTLVTVILLMLSVRPKAGYQLPDGTVAPDDPVQRIVEPQEWERDGFRYVSGASFSLTGRVIRAARYRFDSESSVSPVDVVFGWGPLSDTSVLQRIEFWQSNRFYYWRAVNPPVPASEIISHSANMHLVPANERVREQLVNLDTDDVVSLEGKLVTIFTQEGWVWRSSLSRFDSGAGACEVIWVENLRHVSPTPRSEQRFALSFPRERVSAD